MDLRQLRYLLVIAERGSFTRAAEEIPIAQSALSRHMRLLEEELGTTLLVRTGRGVSLTEQGEFFCEHVRSVLAQLEETRQSLKSWYDNPAGLVRIGMTPTAISGMATMVLEQLTQRYADIHVRLSEGLSATLTEWLAAGRLDLAIVFEQPGNAALEAEKIASEELCLLVPAGFDCPDPVSIEEIAQYKLIAPFAKKGIRNRMADSFKKAGLEFDVTYQIDALSAIKNLVISGAGVSILWRSAVRREVESGELEIRQIASDDMRFGVFILYSKGAQHSRAARAAASVIREIAATFFDA